jgi:hypothetical protein
MNKSPLEKKKTERPRVAAKRAASLFLCTGALDKKKLSFVRE